MIADLVALILISLLILAVSGSSRPKLHKLELTRREWLILACLAFSSLLGWMSQLINNDFKSFDSAPAQSEKVQGR